MATVVERYDDLLADLRKVDWEPNPKRPKVELQAELDDWDECRRTPSIGVPA